MDILSVRIVNISRTSRIHFCFKIHPKCHSNKWGEKPLKLFFLFGHVYPISYTNVWADPTHHPNDSWIVSRTFAQLRHKISLRYNGMLHVHPHIAPSHLVISTHLIHPSLDWRPSPPITPSRSNESFSHSSTTGQMTDRQTDRQMAVQGQESCKNTHALTSILLRASDAANM